MRKDWYLSFNRSTLHPLLSLFIPFFFLLSLSEIISTIFGTAFSIPPIFYLSLLVVGLEEVIVGNILYKEKIAGWERIREVVYILVCAAVVLLLLQRGSLRQRLEALQGILNIYMGVCILLQWLLTAKVHTSLRNREILLTALREKRGENLKHALRESSELAVIALSNLKQVKRIIIFFQVITFALLLGLFAFGVRTGALLVVTVLCHALVGVVFTFILNNAIQDQFLFGEGIFVDSIFQRRRFVYAALIIITVMLLVVSLARQTSILPLSIFQPFLDWLAGLFAPKGRTALRLPRTGSRSNRMDLSKLLSQLPRKPSMIVEILRILIAVLGRIILLGLGILFLFFLFSPLLSNYFKAMLRRLHPLKVLWRRMRALGSYVAGLFKDLFAWIRSPGRDKVKFRKKTKAGNRWRRLKIRKPGLLKRLEIGRILKAFMQLIRWGKRRGIEYKPYIAPLEYANIVSEKFPARRGFLEESMEIMEEALFSPSVLPRQKVKRYLNLIKMIIKGENREPAGL